MHTKVDDIVAALSIEVFGLAPEDVAVARAAAERSKDQSLLDELSIRHLLRDAERDFIHDLSGRIVNPEAPTVEGYPTTARQAPAEGGQTAAMQPGALSRIRSLTDVIRAKSSGDEDDRTRYRVVREHARGGMGRVLAVWDTRMEREVALKELLPLTIVRRGSDADSEAARQRAIARFLQEAQVTGRLQHPSIIPVHEIGERSDGTLYYTMKLVRGQTLRAAIEKAKTLKARMDLLPHYVSLCHAMAYAHAHGVIHRDLKPSNVMIGEFGETLVIDWGLAKETRGYGEATAHESPETEAVEVDEEAPGLTMDGQLLGTPHYMAPEQAAGKHANLDARADVYALGAVLYQLLTGKRPFESLSGLDVLRQVIRESPKSPDVVCPEVPAALAAICARAMAHDPDGRYASARELAEEIVRFQSGALVTAYDYRFRDHVSRVVKRHRPVFATAAFFLLLLLGVATYTLISLRQNAISEHHLRVVAERERYDLALTLAQQSLEEYQYDQTREILDDCLPEYRGWEWGRLEYMLRNVRQFMEGHAAEVVAMVPSRARDRYLSLDVDGVAIFWDGEAGQPLRKFKTNEVSREMVALHPALLEFATCTEDGARLNRWDIATGAQIARYELSGNTVGDIIYAPDGQSLLCGVVDGAVLKYDLGNGTFARTFQAASDGVNALAFSGDGRRLATGDGAGMIHIWDWSSGERLFTLDAHSNSMQVGIQGVIRLAFNSDDTLLASGGCDSTAKIWDVDTGRLRHSLTGHDKKLWSVDFSPDSRMLVSSAERELRFWDVSTGAELPSWIRSANHVMRAYFSSDGKELLVAQSAPVITRWPMDSPFERAYVEAHKAAGNAVAFSSDGRFLATAGGHWLKGGDGRVLLWEVDGMKVPDAPVRILEGGTAWVNSVSFHPDGSVLSSGDQQGNILTWDVATGQLRKNVAVPEYTQGLRIITYSPSGNTFATVGWADGLLAHVTEWDASTYTVIREYSGPRDTIDGIEYSPDGNLIAACSRDSTTHVWDTQTGDTVHVFEDNEGWAYRAAFSPDGETLATTHARSSVSLWDLKSGTLRHRLGGLNTRPENVCFSPDGTRVVACEASRLKVWNVETGAPVLTLSEGANDMAFSPGGRVLVTLGDDGRLGWMPSVDWTK